MLRDMESINSMIDYCLENHCDNALATDPFWVISRIRDYLEQIDSIVYIEGKKKETKQFINHYRPEK